MSSLTENVIAAARSRIGEPFRNHFKPDDLCDHGEKTIDHCMTVGLDDAGYDCSGLIVASLSEALGCSVALWNRDIRHLRQMAKLAQSDRAPQPGDILIFSPENDTKTWMHMGLMATAETTIHADGIGTFVTESPTNEISTNYMVVPLSKLAGLNSPFAVIWDMDGVLIDTPLINWTGIRQVLRSHGVELTDAEVAPLVGQPLQAQFEQAKAVKQMRLTFADFQQEYSVVIEDLLTKHPLKADSKLIKLLDSLSEHGIPMGVGTSSSPKRALRFLEMTGLLSYFEVVVTMDDVTEHKPSPVTFLEVARRLHQPASRCIVIEDAPNGIEAARAGGMKSIGLIGDFNSGTELSKANLIIHDFVELSYERLEQL